MPDISKLVHEGCYITWNNEVPSPTVDRSSGMKIFCKVVAIRSKDRAYDCTVMVPKGAGPYAWFDSKLAEQEDVSNGDIDGFYHVRFCDITGIKGHFSSNG